MSGHNAKPEAIPSSEPRSSAWLELPDGTSFWLTESICSIGRSGNKSIILPHSFVSGSHAVIEEGKGGVHTITDLRSTNGTFLDGRRLNAPSPLANGSKIRIGPFEIIYRSLARVGRNRDSSEMEGGTMVQTYDGPCWLLLLDLEGFTTRRQQLGQAKAEALIREWILEAKPFIESYGGVINGQPGDALFAYWRDDDPAAMPAAVNTGLRGLIALQSGSRETRPFRIVLHRGVVQITTNATRAEQLGGPDVDFLFRIEKLAKPLGVCCLISEPACMGLSLGAEARCLGPQKVADFTGNHVFYTLSPNSSA